MKKTIGIILASILSLTTLGGCSSPPEITGTPSEIVEQAGQIKAGSMEKVEVIGKVSHAMQSTTSDNFVVGLVDQDGDGFEQIDCSFSSDPGVREGQIVSVEGEYAFIVGDSVQLTNCRLV